ncbi:MAG: N-acetylmuramoyl-L-alanine amidase [Actinomycetota bacterium]
MRIIRAGDRGEAVRDVQRRLLGLGHRIAADELAGSFGRSTDEAVRAFQRSRGLPADGMIGPDTWGRLVEAGYRLGDRTLYVRSPLFRGDDVLDLQRRLNQLGFDAGREDGILGAASGQAVLQFQRNIGMRADGIVGPDTVEALERIRPVQPGPSRALVREAEDVRAMRTSIVGSRIALDPGHGPDDPGTIGPSGVTEAELTLLLASDLADALTQLGAIPSIVRTADQTPSPSERARAANDLDATVCVSLHLNAGGPSEQGSTCAYFGTEETYSPAGQRLAERVQDELTSRIGLVDGRTHRLTISLLRETRMPAVQVVPGFLTHPDEERLLVEADDRRRIATAIAEGIAAFFAAPDVVIDAAEHAHVSN